MNRIRWLGQNGSDLVANTTAMSGDLWFAIQIVEEAVFSTLTDESMTTYGTLSGITWPAGALVFGAFSAFTLSSGVVMAYRT